MEERKNLNFLKEVLEEIYSLYKFDSDIGIIRGEIKLKKKTCIVLIVIVILISIFVPIRKARYVYMDTKNNKITSTTYRAYYNIYGMIIYKVFIDYEEY